MPLRDGAAFHDWVEREAPSLAARGVVHAFILVIALAPWRAPSTPVAQLSGQPEFEVRTARLEVPGERPAWIWYRHTYAGDLVDLIAVTNR